MADYANDTRDPGARTPGAPAGAPTWGEGSTGGSPKAPTRRFSRKRVLIPLLLFVLAAIVIVAYWYVYRRGYVSTNDAFIAGDPVTVGSKILGRISDLAVDEGDTTQQGQVLVRLDDTDLRAQEAQAKASLSYTTESVSLARIGVDRAKTDFERAQVQYKDNVVTREQYDHARQALDLAEAQYQVALSQVEASKAQFGVIETQLGNTLIASPLSGVVAKKWAMPGDIATPGQPIFTIYDLRNVWVAANFEETKLSAIHLGAPVRISVDAYPGREFSGKVVLIGAAAASQFSLIPPSNASGNFTKVTQRVPVKISIDDVTSGRDGNRTGLLPGMSVVVKIRVRPQ